MSTLIIACEVMREELLRVLPRAPVRFSFLSMDLHVAPARLHAALAAALLQPGDAERIVLGFGLCGYAIAGLASPHVPLFVPRVHDCIAMLRGGLGPPCGRALEKGTFFLSGGWMEGGRTLGAEHRRMVERFGERKALQLLRRMLGAYRRFTFVRTDHPRRSAREEEARRLSELVGLPLAVVEGDDRFLERIVNGPWDTPEFVGLAPGESVSPRPFEALPGAAPELAAGGGAPCGDDPQGGEVRTG